LGTKRLKIKPFSGRGLAIVIVLLLVNILNFVDRQLPFILIDAIRTELHLNDTQIGLMAGVSFAVVYSFAALGLAWAADRFSARWVIGLSLAFWLRGRRAAPRPPTP
jgi:sugar phosphate permease